jgi:cysteine desulfuration protein SufE
MSEVRPSVVEVEQELLDAFAFLENWTDRYQYIIDLGRQLPPFPDEYKNADKLVRGCQSQVWLHAEMREGRLHLEAASDAIIVSGLVAILLQLYNERTPAEILSASPDTSAQRATTVSMRWSRPSAAMRKRRCGNRPGRVEGRRPGAGLFPRLTPHNSSAIWGLKSPPGWTKFQPD